MKAKLTFFKLALAFSQAFDILYAPTFQMAIVAQW